MFSISVKKAHVFTRNMWGGNPAGIVLPGPTLPSRSMTCIADILNPVSETVFISASEKADHRFRFFTPTSEIDICGHATIGAFFAVYGDIPSEQETMTRHVETACGIFSISLHFVKKKLSTVMMNQGSPRLIDPSVDPGPLHEILGTCPADLIASLPIQVLSTGRPKLIVPLRSMDTLDSLQPDFSRMMEFCDEIGATGVHVFTFETVDPESFVHCRHFAPNVGVEEDPATGNSNAALAGYLLNNRRLERLEFSAEQGYAMGRPSVLRVSVNPQTHEASVGGSALIVMEGSLLLQDLVTGQTD